MQLAFPTPVILNAARALGEATITDDDTELRAGLADMGHADTVRFLIGLARDDGLIRAHEISGAAFAPGGGYMWLAAADWRDRLDAEVAATRAARERERRPPDPRRRSLARIAFAALRDRRPARELLVSLHRHNAGLAEPLPVAEVNRLALWAAEQAREVAHA
jgi:hypothetical protein